MRAALLALMTLPAWACATAIDNAPPDSLRSQHDDGGTSAGGTASTSAGSSASAGKGGAPGAAGNVGGAPPSGGATGGSSSGAGKGGTSNGGTASGGMNSSAGKGGTSSGGTSSGGSAGKGGTSAGGTSAAGTSSGGVSAAGMSSGGMSAGGTSSSATCDAAHAVATLTTSSSYTGKANDCVRLVVDPTWATISVQLQPLPGTQGYPVPFSFFNCGGNGTGSLTADYANATLKSGSNPGCDFFVQFGGGETTIKVTYYD